MDTLIILSDVDGLYDNTKKKKLIKEVKIIDKNIYSLSDKKLIVMDQEVLKLNWTQLKFV